MDKFRMASSFTLNGVTGNRSASINHIGKALFCLQTYDLSQQFIGRFSRKSTHLCNKLSQSLKAPGNKWFAGQMVIVSDFTPFEASSRHWMR